jgi:hypothetical protein
MPSYFLPYPKSKPRHNKYKPPPLQTTGAKAENQPYPHPQPDPPNNPPSPLNLASPSPPSTSSSASPNLDTSASSSFPSRYSGSSSSSSSSTIKASSATHRRHNDYNPSSLNLQLVFGNPHDPSLVIIFGLNFREGRRPKVKFSVKRGHGRVRGLEEVLGVGGDGEGRRKEGGGENRRKETGEEGEGSGERDARIRGKARDGEERSRGKKRKRDSEN